MDIGLADIVGDVDQGSIGAKHRSKGISGADGNGVGSDGVEFTEGRLFLERLGREPVPKPGSIKFHRSTGIGVWGVGGVIGGVGQVGVKGRIVDECVIGCDGDGQPCLSDEIPTWAGLDGQEVCRIPTQQGLGVPGIKSGIEGGKSRGNWPIT